MSKLSAHAPQAPAPSGRGALAAEEPPSSPTNQWADFQAARERFFATLRGEASAVVGARRAGGGEGP